jgi:chromosome segregation ATPase
MAYDKAVKRAVLEVAEQEGVSVASKKFNIHKDTINNWIAQAPEIDPIEQAKQDLWDWQQRLKTVEGAISTNKAKLEAVERELQTLKLDELQGLELPAEAIEGLKNQRDHLKEEIAEGDPLAKSIQGQIEKVKQDLASAQKDQLENELGEFVSRRSELNAAVEKTVETLVTQLRELVVIGNKEHSKRLQLKVSPGRLVKSEIENFLGWKLGEFVPVIRVPAALRKTLADQYSGNRQNMVK